MKILGAIKKISVRAAAVLSSRPSAFITAAAAAFTVLLFHSARGAHYMMNWHAFGGITALLYAVFILNAAAALTALFLFDAAKARAVTPETNGGKGRGGAFARFDLIMRITRVTTAAVTPALLIIAAVILSRAPAGGHNLYAALPFAAGALVALYAFTLHGKLLPRARKITALALVLAIIIPFASVTLHLYPFKLTSEPLVLDLGAGANVFDANAPDGYYSVVFATNDEATGFIVYSYDDGGGEREYKVYATEAGQISTGRLHAVRVPRRHLQNNAYRAGATRVLRETAYGATFGRTVTTAEYAFRGELNDEQTVIAASDWHCNVRDLLSAAANVDKPDLVLLLGDAADYLDDEAAVIEYIVKAGAGLTKSVVPALFVRGNHETRGEGGRGLAAKLGLSEYYYQTARGAYLFSVFDCGEDKADDDREYGGLAAYENYMRGQLKWTEKLPVPPADVTHIALCHAPNFNFRPELREAWNGELKRLNVKGVIGGHTHSLKCASDENGILRLEDGGKDSKGYVLCEVKLTPLSAAVRAFNPKGLLKNFGVFDF